MPRESRGLLRVLYNPSRGVRPWHLSSSTPTFCLSSPPQLSLWSMVTPLGVHVWVHRERGTGRSHCRCLDPDAICTSGYGQAQYTACWGVPTPLQEAWEELAIVKVVVTSLEEAALARSQRTESDRRCAGEWASVSSLCFLVSVMSYSWRCFVSRGARRGGVPS
jgi:hypothetical protein